MAFEGFDLLGRGCLNVDPDVLVLDVPVLVEALCQTLYADAGAVGAAVSSWRFHRCLAWSSKRYAAVNQHAISLES